ncbi:MAG: 3-deoxy-8-phosphooctulonate synthase [Halobacteriovoraceae bacterium]|nr:3-deoxy-8-phosphooctulonate synthase [Halobacteriovoraceae bacterium]|tara:strand:+ start:13499 stop:14299 length:801 start_codon:yes stop_codon:yes gene_type:complete
MKKMDFFIGPCVLESEKLAMNVAERLVKDLEEFSSQMQLTFKGSFDKANRSAIDSYRGPGIDEGLRILEKIKNEFKLPVITDYHLPDQADQVASVVDTLQVPAFLCRQTDMVLAGAEACKKYGGRLKIKKGQFLAPWDAKNIVEKASNFLPPERILLTERGTSFGYNNLVVDMASFQIMKEFGCLTIHDATHSVQKPGGLGKSTGGKRDQIYTLAKAAAAAGADGFFMEAHPDPENALSDATSQLPIEKIKPLVEVILKIKEATRG